MNKNFDQRRNQQVIEMRRATARTCIRSLRRCRVEGSRGEIAYVTSRTQEAIASYRQTVKVLIANV